MISSLFLFLPVVVLIQPSESVKLQYPIRKLPPFIDELKKDYGIVVEEVSAVAQFRGNGVVWTRIDFSPFVKGLRACVKDVYNELENDGQTPDETKIIARRRLLLGKTLKYHQKAMEKEITQHLSKYRAIEDHEIGRPSLKVDYDLPKSKTGRYFDTPIHQKIKEEAQRNDSTRQPYADLIFERRLDSMFRDYRADFMRQFEEIHHQLQRRNVSSLLLKNNDLQKIVISGLYQPHYEHSLFKYFPNEAQSLISARRIFYLSKMEILVEIDMENYIINGNEVLLKIDTQPKLKQGFYVQSILPRYIIVNKNEKEFNRITTIDGKLEGKMIGGYYCGKHIVLPVDCNIKERKGCPYVITPKKTFERHQQYSDTPANSFSMHLKIEF